MGVKNAPTGPRFGSGGSGAPEYFTIVIDEKGSFNINCAAATYEIRCDPDNTFPEWYGEPNSIVVERGETTRIELKFTTMAQLLIKVTHSETGEPIPRVGVGLKDAVTGEPVSANSKLDSNRGLTPDETTQKLLQNCEEIRHQLHSASEVTQDLSSSIFFYHPATFPFYIFIRLYKAQELPMHLR